MYNIYMCVCVSVYVNDCICAYHDQKYDCQNPPMTRLTTLLAFQHGVNPIVWHSTCKHM
jgi:hypothetical protein